MRKGSLLDIFLIPVILFVFGISIIVASLILGNMSSLSIFSGSTGTSIYNNANTAVGTFNWTFIFVAVVLGLGSIAMGFMYPSHPILFVFGVIILATSMIVTPQISNAFGTFASNSEISSTASNFNMITWFMSNSLPIFMTVIGGLMLIALFSKIRQGNA